MNKGCVNKRAGVLVVSGVIIWLVSLALQAEEYVSQEAFLSKAFGGKAPSNQTLWLQADHKKAAQTILGHGYSGLRVRYWQQGSKTAWILHEIGKERPIRIGVVLKSTELDKNTVSKKAHITASPKPEIESVTILAFEESRGWEVRYPFFTQQFEGVSLKSDRSLTESIDGITGATLSVRAVTNTARLALYFHQVVHSNQVARK